MSDLAPIHFDTSPLDVETSWHVRRASVKDLKAVATAVSELLVELGGTPPPATALAQAARALLDEPDAGALLVAQNDDRIVGVLGASWQFAIHVPGRYALVQDLWVHPRWRGRAIGSDLLAALFALAREREIVRVEVGLPTQRFAHFRSTEAFYLGNGFSPLGPRMRKVLS